MIPERNLFGTLAGTRAVTSSVLIQFSHTAGPKLGLQVAREISNNNTHLLAGAGSIDSKFSTSSVVSPPALLSTTAMMTPLKMQAEAAEAMTEAEKVAEEGLDARCESKQRTDDSPNPEQGFDQHRGTAIVRKPAVVDTRVGGTQNKPNHIGDGSSEATQIKVSLVANGSDSDEKSGSVYYCREHNTEALRRWIMRYVLSDLQLTPDCYDGDLMIMQYNSDDILGGGGDYDGTNNNTTQNTTNSDFFFSGCHFDVIVDKKENVRRSSNYGRIMRALHTNNSAAADFRYYFPPSPSPSMTSPQSIARVNDEYFSLVTPAQIINHSTANTKGSHTNASTIRSFTSSSSHTQATSPTTNHKSKSKNTAATTNTNSNTFATSPHAADEAPQRQQPFNQQFGLDWNWKIITLPEIDVSFVLFLFGAGDTGAEGGDASLVTALAICVETEYLDVLYARADSVIALIITALHRPAEDRPGGDDSDESVIFGAEGVAFACPTKIAELVELCECVDQVLAPPPPQSTTLSMRAHRPKRSQPTTTVPSTANANAAAPTHSSPHTGAPPTPRQRNDDAYRSPRPADVCVENSHFVSLDERDVAWIQKLGIALTAALLSPRVIVYGEDAMDVHRMLITIACLLPSYRFHDGSA